MSNYNSTATATIYVNGQPAQQTIAKLKDDIIGYRMRLQEIAADKSLGVNSKEWNDVRKKMVEAEKELGRVQSGVANVTQVMLRLDKATPNELRKSLRQLKSELDNIERGSRAWDEHQRKIKAVKEELAKINNESKAVHGNLWDRFAKKMFDWGAAIQTVMSAVTVGFDPVHLDALATQLAAGWIVSVKLDVPFSPLPEYGRCILPDIIDSATRLVRQHIRKR